MLPSPAARSTGAGTSSGIYTGAAGIYLQAIIDVATAFDALVAIDTLGRLGKPVVKHNIHRRCQIHAADGRNVNDAVCSIDDVLRNGAVLRAKNVERMVGVYKLGEECRPLSQLDADNLHGRWQARHQVSNVQQRNCAGRAFGIGVIPGGMAEALAGIAHCLRLIAPGGTHDGADVGGGFGIYQPDEGGFGSGDAEGDDGDAGVHVIP